MIDRILSWIALFAVGVLVIALSVANRQWQKFSLDPFNPTQPIIYIELPMWTYLLAMFAVGAIAGGFVAWMGQGKWRELARQRAQDAVRWKGEADRLIRERDAAASTASSARSASGTPAGRKLLEIARR